MHALHACEKEHILYYVRRNVYFSTLYISTLSLPDEAVAESLCFCPKFMFVITIFLIQLYSLVTTFTE